MLEKIASVLFLKKYLQSSFVTKHYPPCWLRPLVMPPGGIHIE